MDTVKVGYIMDIYRDTMVSALDIIPEGGSGSMPTQYYPPPSVFNRFYPS